MVCRATPPDDVISHGGRFIVGAAYRFREGNENHQRTTIYTVAKRSAKFVTLVAVGSSRPPRRLAVRIADDGTECVLVGHPKSCMLRLLWSVNHATTSPAGWTMSSEVLPCSVKLVTHDTFPPPQ